MSKFIAAIAVAFVMTFSSVAMARNSSGNRVTTSKRTRRSRFAALALV